MQPDIVAIVAPDGQRSAGVNQAVEDFLALAPVAQARHASGMLQINGLEPPLTEKRENAPDVGTKASHSGSHTTNNCHTQSSDTRRQNHPVHCDCARL